MSIQVGILRLRLLWLHRSCVWWAKATDLLPEAIITKGSHGNLKIFRNYRASQVRDNS